MSRSSHLLKELSWACCLSTVEVLKFGSCGWWWRLRWAVTREFQGLDIPQVTAHYRQGEPDELSYGETPTVTLARILEISRLPHEGRFVDLGAGRGTTVLAARLMGYGAAGIELIEEYVQRSRRVAQRLKLDIDLRQGDFLQEEWPEGELYLLNSTAFPKEFRNKVSLRLEQLRPNTLVATYDWSLSPQKFEELNVLRLPVTRGTVLCRLFRVF